jgi:REP element-mobilizing transposase RayT
VAADPRGSSSHEIRVERVAALGEFHHGRRAVQPPSAEVRAFYRDAREVLRHELLPLDEHDRLVVAASIAIVLAQRGYVCHACAIMPDHVHALIRRHRDRAEDMMDAFRQASRTALVGGGKRPSNHPVWGAGPGWKVFLDTREDMVRVVRYIEENPVKARLPRQYWSFVQPYDGWLPHPNR